MKRKIIEIDQDKCDGCGLCVTACHEGAIQLVDGKARLVRDDFCDGLGDCLPSCPTGAITFVEREAVPYNEAAVISAQMAKAKTVAHATMPSGGCPGSAADLIARDGKGGGSGAAGVNAAGDMALADDDRDAGTHEPAGGVGANVASELAQWPIQIKLAPVNASFFKHAKLLVAADCSAFAYGSFHCDFMRGRICLIGCPKLDGVDYTEKLGEIVRANDIDDVLVVRMQVPCCGGIEHAARAAADLAGHLVHVRVVTLATDGTIVGDVA